MEVSSSQQKETEESAHNYTIDNAENVIMHEDDAEMLERGVENDQVSEPPTPYEASKSLQTCLSPPPSMDLGESAVDNRCLKFEDNSCCLTSSTENTGSTMSSTETTTATTFMSGTKDIHQGQESVISFPKTIVEHLPLSDVVPSGVYSELSSNLGQNLELSKISERFDSSLKNHHQREESLLGDDIFEMKSYDSEDSSTDVQKKKYHRRLHESAQFAEAVGEPQNGMIQVIIDDDDDDSSDDDSVENAEEGPAHDTLSVHDIVDIHDLDAVAGDLLEETKRDNSAQVHFDVSFTKSTPSNIHIDSMKSTSSTATTPQSLDRHCLNLDDTLEAVDYSNEVRDEFKDEVNENNDSRHEIEMNDSYHKRSSRFPSERSMSEGDLNTMTKEEKAKEDEKNSMNRVRSFTYQFFHHKLPLEETGEENNDVFKGIVSPEITKRGLSRGNYAQLHRKAWLEVSDKYHRYGKNLRTYYKHWEKLGHPTNMFFDWLDVKGEAAGWEQPNLPECPREILDNDRVLYITDQDEQEKFLLKIVPQQKGSATTSEEGLKGTPSQIVDKDGKSIKTGPSGWIFVLRDHELYGAEKCTKSKIDGKGGRKLRFHHSSFFGGKAVAAAGILITDDDGYLTRIYPHSGHYRPSEPHMQRMLYYLYNCGVDLNSFYVDMQQIMHVSREVRDAQTPKGMGDSNKGNDDSNNDTEKGETNATIPVVKKAKKTDSLHLKDATFVALFLGHKARSIGKGLFKMIHKIRPLRRVEPNSVTTILDSVDNGGFWKTNK